MIRWLRSLFAWRVVRLEGVWLYEANQVTGQRRAFRVVSGGYSPLDLDWLDGAGPRVPHPEINGRPAWRSAEGQADGRWCY